MTESMHADVPTSQVGGGSSTTEGVRAGVEQARDTAMGITSDARREAGSVAQEARQQAQRALGQSRDQLRTQADEHARNVASSLRGIGSQLGAMGSAPNAGEGPVVDLVKQLASSVERAASTLDDGGIDSAMFELRRFARNRPAVFLAGAVGAGFVVGRLLRASDMHGLVETVKDAVGGDGGSDGGSAGSDLGTYGTADVLGASDLTGLGAAPGGAMGSLEATGGYGATDLASGVQP